MIVFVVRCAMIMVDVCGVLSAFEFVFSLD